jgi:plastocyanin
MTGGLFYTTPATSPPSLTVAVGAPVTWLNNSGVFHNVTFGNPFAARAVGSGGSGNIAEHISGSNQRQFNSAGTYIFECTLHLGMEGRVVVQ